MANLNTLYKKYSHKFDLTSNYLKKQGKDMVMPYKYSKEAFANAYNQAKVRLGLDLENAGKANSNLYENAVINKMIDIQKYGNVSKKEAHHLQKMMKEREGIELTLNEAKRAFTVGTGIYSLSAITKEEMAVAQYFRDQSEYNEELKRKGYSSEERAHKIGQVFHGSP